MCVYMLNKSTHQSEETLQTATGSIGVTKNPDISAEAKEVM